MVAGVVAALGEAENAMYMMCGIVKRVVVAAVALEAAENVMKVLGETYERELEMT